MTMTDKEKLVALLKGNLPHFMNDIAYWQDEHVAELADHLLSHGVTIREPGKHPEDDCFREKIEHQLKGIYEHLRDIDNSIEVVRAQIMPLQNNIMPEIRRTNYVSINEKLKCNCGAPMKGESNA